MYYKVFLYVLPIDATLERVVAAMICSRGNKLDLLLVRFLVISD